MTWKLLSFIITHLLLGKKVSIAYGIALNLNLWVVLFTAFLIEIITIPIFFFIYEILSKKINFIAKWKEKLDKKTKKSKIFQKLAKHGYVGVFILALHPFVGGGILTSSLLSYILKIKKPIAYLIIILGTILSLFLLAGLFNWFFALFK